MCSTTRTEQQKSPLWTPLHVKACVGEVGVGGDTSGVGVGGGTTGVGVVENGGGSRLV